MTVKICLVYTTCYHHKRLEHTVQRHRVINHCDRCITHLGEFFIWKYLLLCLIYLQNFRFLLRVLPDITHNSSESKSIDQTKRYISITKKSDMSSTVIYHNMSLTVLYYCEFMIIVVCQFSCIVFQRVIILKA
jgi:hypothetical protein